MAPSYDVKRRFLDKATGKYVNPGDAFKPSSAAQAEHLEAARCPVKKGPAAPPKTPSKAPAGPTVRKNVPPAAAAAAGAGAAPDSPPVVKPVNLHTVKTADLLELAAERKIELPEGATRAQVIQAISAAAAPPAGG